jgi:hypothetical protein
METDQQSEQLSQPSRLPFDVEFFQLVEKITGEALEKVPELQGIAVVPIWHNQPENTPPGMLRLRDARPPYLASLMQLLARLAAFNVEVNKDLVNQIRVFDAHAAQLVEEIKKHTETLEQIKTNAN